jgi:tRNA (guanine-N7-)-methyltransferase
MKSEYSSILNLENLTLPLDLKQLGFSGAELEIGFGNGEYMIARAIACPDTLLMGIEVSASCVARCLRRVNRFPTGAPANLKIIRADARFVMKELFSDAALGRVVMNFPCPWPKTCHAKRRVTTREFADDLAAVLKTGGVFEMVTDEERYALEAKARLDRHEAFSATELETNPPRSITTKYERKWLEMGKTITRLRGVRTRDFTVARRTWFLGSAPYCYERESGTMHVKTGKPLPEKGLAFLFDTSGIREDSRWVFKKHYAETDGQGGNKKNFLVETISTDDEFEQHYYLKVVEHGCNTLVKLDGTAKVFLTPAVRFSVEDLARRLAEASVRTDPGA